MVSLIRCDLTHIFQEPLFLLLPSDFLVTEHQFCRLLEGLNGVMIKEKSRTSLGEAKRGTS